MKRRSRIRSSVASDNNVIKLSESFCHEILDSVKLNSERWWCMVILIVESSERHKHFVRMFNEIAQSGKRKSIYNLSYKKLISNVKRLAKEDIKSCGAAQRICHFANDLLDNCENIPTWLLGRLIKYQIYRAKAENVSRLKAEMDLADDIDREFNLMQTQFLLEATNTRPDSLTRSNTVIRKRGEEWKDGGAINDSPIDGPNLYVILTGFYDVQLIKELCQIGVPLKAILKVKNSYENIKFTGDSELDKFWMTLEEEFKNSLKLDQYCNMVLMNLCHPQMKEYLDDAEYDCLLSDIYDRVSHVAYDIFDCYRLHARYLKSIELVTFEDARFVPVKSVIYEKQISKIPEDLISVPLIVQAILEQLKDDLGEGEIDFGYEDEENEEIFENDMSSHDEYVCKFVQKLYSHCMQNDLIGNDTDKEPCQPAEGEEWGRFVYSPLLESLFYKEKSPVDVNRDSDSECDCFWNMFQMFLEMGSVKSEDVKHYLNFLALRDVLSKIDDSEFGMNTEKGLSEKLVSL